MTRPAMPAEPVALARYLVDQATTTRVTTLTRRLSAIAKAHLLAGHDDPTGAPAVRGVLRGLRRDRGTTQRGAPPLWTSDVERILAATHTVPNPTWGPGHGTAEVRDRALLLLAFTSALRRSELAALDVADLEPDPAGLVVHVTRGKTDQNAEGALVGIPHASRPRLCAVTAIDAWRLRLATLLDVDPAEADGPAVPAGRPPWPARLARREPARPGRPPVRRRDPRRRGPAGPYRRPVPRTRPAVLHRALHPVRLRHPGRRQRRQRTRDHGPGPVAIAAGRPRLHPPRQRVHRQRRRVGSDSDVCFVHKIARLSSSITSSSVELLGVSGRACPRC